MSISIILIINNEDVNFFHNFFHQNFSKIDAKNRRCTFCNNAKINISKAVILQN